jgi:hypothetical protein
VLRHLEASLLLQIAHMMRSRFSRKTAKLRTAVKPVKDIRAGESAVSDTTKARDLGRVHPPSISIVFPQTVE